MAAPLDLRSRTIGPALADLVRDARRLIGWSQRELAARAETSQTMIWRIETGHAEHLDVAVIEHILAALGMRPRLEVQARHLEDRRRQQDLVHAILNPYVDRRLRRDRWLTRSEAQVGEPDPRGWIDTLAFRPADRALLVEETKTDIPDMGGLQRQLSSYERAAWAAAQRLGWRPRTVHVLVVCLDTGALRARLADNREGLSIAFPGLVDDALAWLSDPQRTAPQGWTIALADPASRSARWLRAARRVSRVPAPYADYADAARALVLRGARRRAG